MHSCGISGMTYSDLESPQNSSSATGCNVPQTPRSASTVLPRPGDTTCRFQHGLSALLQETVALLAFFSFLSRTAVTLSIIVTVCAS